MARHRGLSPRGARGVDDHHGYVRLGCAHVRGVPDMTVLAKRLAVIAGHDHEGYVPPSRLPSGEELIEFPVDLVCRIARALPQQFRIEVRRSIRAGPVPRGPKAIRPRRVRVAEVGADEEQEEELW